jgi:hypothetical protein
MEKKDRANRSVTVVVMNVERKRTIMINESGWSNIAIWGEMGCSRRTGSRLNTKLKNSAQ